ncbi:MAG: helix-turn-helix domain-containing protein [Pseudonocardiaceae bacterium]
MARQPPELAEQQRLLGRYLAALREAAGLYQADIARAVPCHRTNVTHAEAGSQLPDAHFWETADRVVGANGALVTGYDALIQAKQAHATTLQAQRRAKAQAAVRRLRAASPPARSDKSASLGDAVAKTPLHQIEVLRHGLDETISERTITTASLDDWEKTVFHHGQATRDRAPGVLLEDLSADLAQLHGALTRCRSASALRRLTRVTAQMTGLMCLTLIKLDQRSAFRRWARTARPSVGGALAAALEARVQAALGHQQETRSALGHAETCLSHLDVSAIGTSAFDYSEAQLRFHEGNTFTHLHDTSAAWQAQEIALALCPASDYMDRTMTKLDRANCLAHDGDVTGAVAVMVEAATPLTDQQRQGIIAAQVRETIAALPPQHHALPAVRDLHDLLPPSPETKDNI